MLPIRMNIESTRHETEIEVRLGAQVIHAQSLRAGRSAEQEVVDAARSALQRVSALGRPRRILLKPLDSSDDRLAERLSGELGVSVEIGI